MAGDTPVPIQPLHPPVIASTEPTPEVKQEIINNAIENAEQEAIVTELHQEHLETTKVEEVIAEQEAEKEKMAAEDKLEGPDLVAEAHLGKLEADNQRIVDSKEKAAKATEDKPAPTAYVSAALDKISKAQEAQEAAEKAAQEASEKAVQVAAEQEVTRQALATAESRKAARALMGTVAIRDPNVAAYEDPRRYEKAAAVLGIPLTAETTENDIERAFRKSSLRCHPDKQNGKTDEEKAAAAIEFENISKARVLLKSGLESNFAVVENNTAAPLMIMSQEQINERNQRYSALQGQLAQRQEDVAILEQASSGSGTAPDSSTPPPSIAPTDNTTYQPKGLEAWIEQQKFRMVLNPLDPRNTKVLIKNGNDTLLSYNNGTIRAEAGITKYSTEDQAKMMVDAYIAQHGPSDPSKPHEICINDASPALAAALKTAAQNKGINVIDKVTADQRIQAAANKQPQLNAQAPVVPEEEQESQSRMPGPGMSGID